MRKTFSQLIGRIWPLIFFSLPGVLVALVGLGLAYFRVLGLFVSAGEVAIGSALFAVGLIICGLISFFSGLILYFIASLRNSLR